MNQVKVTNQVIAKNLIKSLEKLLNASVRYQSVYTPKGKPIERIVIEYEKQQD